MLTVESILKLIDNGFSHDEIMALTSTAPSTSPAAPEPVPAPVPEPVPAEPPAVVPVAVPEPVAVPVPEPVPSQVPAPVQEGGPTLADIQKGIANLVHLVQAGNIQNSRMPEAQKLSLEDVMAEIINPTGGKKHEG